MTSIVDQPSPVASRRSVWDLLIEHVEQRSPALGPAIRVDQVLVDLRSRSVVVATRVDRPSFEGRCCPAVARLDGHHFEDCPTHEGRDYLVRAYDNALDIAAHFAAELDECGVTLDDPIDVRGPGSSRLVRLQAMLWDHIRTIVQLRALIEERIEERTP